MNATPHTQPIFQFFDVRAADAPQVLGVWEVTPMPQPSASHSFAHNDAGLSDLNEAQIWRISLPPDMKQAHAYLDAGASRLELAEQALAQVPERVSGLAAAWHTGQSFDLSTLTAMPQPEAGLLASLGEMESGAQLLSFDAGVPEGVGKWRQTLQQFLDFVEQLRKSFTRYAWVETRLSVRLVARTSVGWAGDVDTVWAAKPSAAEAAIHRRALMLAIQTRAALARTLIIVVQAAVKISLLLSTPVTAPLALLAAYRYVQAISAQLKFMPAFG
jgi:hypothetical protein